MAQTSLSSQLKRLKTPQTSLFRQSKVRHSFLYEPEEAIGIEEDVHYALAISGLGTLIAFDENIERFRDILFSDRCKEMQRGLLSSEANSQLSEHITEFLDAVVAPYFLTSSTHKVLEWLIFKYQVNEFEEKHLIWSVMPYHETKLFTRIIRICPSTRDQNDPLIWLKPSRKYPLLMQRVVNHAKSSNGFLKELTDVIMERAKKFQLKKLIGFANSLLLAFLDQTESNELNEPLVKVFLDYASSGFKSSNISFRASSYVVFAQLCFRTQLLQKRVEKMLTRMIKGFSRCEHTIRVETMEGLILTLASVCESQKLDSLPKNTFAHIDHTIVMKMSESVQVSMLLAKMVAFFIRDAASNPDQFSVVIDILNNVKSSEVVRTTLQALVLAKQNSQISIDEHISKILHLLEQKYPSHFDQEIRHLDGFSVLENQLSVVPSFISELRMNLWTGLVHANPDIRLASVKHAVTNFERLKEDERLREALHSFVRDSLQNPADAELSVECLKLIDLLTAEEVQETFKQLIPRAFTARKACQSEIRSFTKWTALLNKIIVIFNEHQFGIEYYYSLVIWFLFPEAKDGLSLFKKLCRTSHAQFFQKLNWKIEEISSTNDIIRLMCTSTVLDSNDTIFLMKYLCASDKMNHQILFLLMICSKRVPDDDQAPWMFADAISSLEKLLTKRLKQIKEPSKSFGELIELNMKHMEKGRLTFDVLGYILCGLMKLVIDFIQRISSKKTSWFWCSDAARGSPPKVFFEYLLKQSNPGAVATELHQTQLKDYLHQLHTSGISASFLSSYWSLSDSAPLQTRALELSQCESLDEPEVLSLLISLESDSLEARKSAERILLSAPNNEEMLLVIQENSSDIVACDEAELLTILTENKFDAICAHIAAESTPPQVRRGLVSLLKDRTSCDLMQSLVPLFTTALDKSELNHDEKEMMNDLKSMLLSVLASAPEDISEDVTSLFLKLLKTYPQSTVVDMKCDWFEKLSQRLQVQILKHLLDILVSEMYDASIERRVKKLLSNGILISQLVTDLIAAPVDSSRSKRRRTTTMLSSIDLSQKNWATVEVILELVQNRSSFHNPTSLMNTLQCLIRATYLVDNTASLEYFRFLLFTTLRSCISLPDVDMSLLEISSVLTVFSFSRKRETHREALLIISFLAPHFKAELMANIVPVFSFIAGQMSHRTDEYSQHVLNETLEAFVPVIASEKKSKGKQQVIIEFVNAFSDIPDHQRLYLFTRIVQLLEDEVNLSTFTILLLCKRQLDLLSDSDSIGAFVGGFIAQRNVDIQLLILKLLLNAASHFDLNMEFAFGSKGKSIRMKVAKEMEAPKLVTLLVETVLRAFEDPILVERLSSISWDSLELPVTGVIEELFVFIDRLSKNSKNEKTKKYREDLKSKLYKVLSRLNMLLPDREIVFIMKHLMQDEKCSVKKKAIDILMMKIKNHGNRFDSEQMLQVMKPLTKIVRDSATNDSEASRSTGEMAMLAIRQLVKLFPKDNVMDSDVLAQLAKILNLLINSLGEKVWRIHPSTTSACLLCVAQLTVALDSQAIPFLPSVFDLICTHIGEKSSMCCLSSVGALIKLIKHFGNFVSSHLTEIVVKVCTFKFNFISDARSWKQLNVKLEAFRKAVALEVPTRILLPVLEKAHNTMKGMDVEWRSDFLALLSEAVSVADKESLENVIRNIEQLILQVLSYRFTNEDASSEIVDGVEDQAIDCVIKFSPKLSEVQFRSLFVKLHNWAFGGLSTTDKSRALIFFKLTSRLVDRLRSLFATLVGPMIIENAAIQLEDIPTDEETGVISHHVVENVLTTLSKCFVHDINQHFASEDRVKRLLDPIVNQLGNLSGTEEQVLHRVNACLIPCVKHLVQAVQESDMVRHIHTQVLLKSRSDDEDIRFNALLVYHSVVLCLNDEYHQYLAEATPFLTDLHDDESPKIRTHVKETLRDIESIIGEPVGKYL